MPLSENRKADADLAFRAAHRLDRQRDTAGFRELHRIVDQVFPARREAGPDRRPPTLEASPKYRSRIAGPLPPPGRPASPRCCAPAPADRRSPAATAAAALPLRAASTNKVARLARCSAPALMVSTQRRSRSSRSEGREQIADGQNSGQRRADLVRERRERRFDHTRDRNHGGTLAARATRGNAGNAFFFSRPLGGRIGRFKRGFLAPCIPTVADASMPRSGRGSHARGIFNFG